jgi:hypothetical protein
MDENTLQELSRLREALKALTSAADKSLFVEQYRGTGRLHVKNYRRLHARVMEILPDDGILSSYTLDDDAEDEQSQVAEVRLLAEQLNMYLRGLLREAGPHTAEFDDLRNLGGELRDQIINMTKRSLQQALSNLDLGFTGEEGEFDADFEVPHSGPHKRKVKVRVQLDKDRGEDDNPPDETINL